MVSYGLGDCLLQPVATARCKETEYIWPVSKETCMNSRSGARHYVSEATKSFMTYQVQIYRCVGSAGEHLLHLKSIWSQEVYGLL